MKLFHLYLEDGTEQEMLAFRISQALTAARCRVVGYAIHTDWEV